MLTSATFYNDNIAIIINTSATKHVVNNKMTNLTWQNNVDNTKDLNIEKELVLEPNECLQRCHVTLKQKKPKSPSTLKPTIMQTVCKRV
jgi:cytochrome b involved in lipid metabolism